MSSDKEKIEKGIAWLKYLIQLYEHNQVIMDIDLIHVINILEGKNPLSSE